MLLILLAVFSLTAESFTQDTNGTTYVVDTKDDLVQWWTVSAESMGYSNNFSQFIHDATQLASKVPEVVPPPEKLTSIQGFEGLWWTLWDNIYESWEGKATFGYSNSRSLQYLSLSYTLCGKSSITVTSLPQVLVVINNTKADEVNFTCDGLMKQSEFKLGAVYAITIELNVYSDEEVKSQPGFALIDKISTIYDSPATPGPRPNTTRHTWIPELPTTAIAQTTTEENSDGGAAFARIDAMLCAVLFVFICTAV